MIKFPQFSSLNSPRSGPLRLPDGWLTRFFLPSALPRRASGGGVGGFPGSTKDCGPCHFQRGLSAPEPALGQAAVAGGVPSGPRHRALTLGLDCPRLMPSGCQQG